MNSIEASPVAMNPMIDVSQPAWGRLAQDDFGQLVLIPVTSDLAADMPVVPVRAFPIAAPDEGLSLVGTDGREVLWIDRLTDLPADQLKLVLAALHAREFSPVIQKLVSVSGFSTPCTWCVQTDRGATEFVLKTEDDIRRLDAHQLLITGSQGITYRVPDRQALDSASKRLLERFL
jgi:hypothetical protein